MGLVVMQLKSIELSGFKSFAKSSKLDFNSAITAVVGPNGSGKSNVAEAFRFALGEQSIKSMRGKKGEDLIWNGSDDTPRAGRASTKVTFDNTNKLFDLDFSEVVVERVVNRDGTNEYRLNGSTVRLKDVYELLSRAHIGSSGHHIISQGEADKILTANLRDRKAIIEDALGLKLYQYKREESERKLEKTFENLTQVEALRKEIAPHLKFLKKQMDKIARVDGMRKDLEELGLKYFKYENLYLQTTDERIKSEKAPVEDKLQKLARELSEAKRILEDSAKSDKKEYQVLGLEREIAGIRALKDGYQRELGKIEGALLAEERILKREQAERESEEFRTIKLKEVEELFEEVSLLSQVEQIFTRIKEFIRARKHGSDSRVSVEAEARIADLNREKEKIEAELKNASGKEDTLRRDYEALKKGIEEDKDSSRDAEKAVFRIMSEQNELLTEKRLLTAEEEKLHLEKEEFKREVTEVAHLAGKEVLRYQEQASAHPLPSREEQNERKKEIQKLKIRLEDAGAGGSEDVIKEYRDVSERDEFLEREVTDLTKSAESLKGLIKDLDEKLQAEFAVGLERINKEFSIFFKDMFGGGEAKLILIKESKNSPKSDFENLDLKSDSGELDNIEEGLDIAVSLPRKKIRGLAMLSGGERALTSIALIFAISQVNPPPFIILDETDAALDEANSRKYGEMVERLSKRSQLILITHNRETMSRAGTIYGVTMNSNGASKLLSIAFDEAVQVAK